MAGLQRSSISFRRQGSSGIIWDDQFLSGEPNQQPKNESQEQSQEQAKTASSDGQELQGGGIKLTPIKTVGSTIERSRSNGGGGGRRHSMGKVSPAIDPPSPKLSAFGCCSAFGKNKSPVKKINNKDPRKRTGKHKSR